MKKHQGAKTLAQPAYYWQKKLYNIFISYNISVVQHFKSVNDNVGVVFPPKM